MTTARCPACGAAVAVGASWCTLCFADLRPAPEPERVSVGAPPAADLEPAALPPHPILDGPLPLIPDGPLPEDAHLDAPVSQASDITLAPPAWPCHRCGEMVALDLTECPVCGGGFLDPARDDTVINLPLVGDLRRFSSAGRLAVMAGGMAVFATLLFLVYVVLGALL